MNKQRRKAIQNAINKAREALDVLRDCAEQEREYFDNMPESLQSSERGEKADNDAYTLDSAANDLENVIDSLSEFDNGESDSWPKTAEEKREEASAESVFVAEELAHIDNLDHFKARAWITDAAVRVRIIKERAVIRRFASDAIGKGYLVAVHDGEEFACMPTASVGIVMNAVMGVDEEHLYVYRKGASNEEPLTRIGTVFLVYGNDGFDVIADYSDNETMRELMKGAESEAERIENL